MDGASGDDGVGADWASAGIRGLMVHSTLAFTPERVPLGLLAQEVWARDPEKVGQRATRAAAGDYGEREWQVVTQSGGGE